jgi:hypothetical protein
MDENCASRDLVCSSWACLLWCLPTIMLVVGLSWPTGRTWLWIPALVVAGGTCIVNAGRCGRLHCYITGPFFLLAAVYVVLAEFHIVPLQPGRFLLVVLVVSVAACLAQFPLGSYVKKAGPTR